MNQGLSLFEDMATFTVQFVNDMSQFSMMWIVNCGNTNGQRAIVWVFIAQMVEHRRANAEAMGSNPVEGPKSFFFRANFAIT